MNHVNKRNTSLELSHDPTSTSRATDPQTTVIQQSNMAEPMNILDRDTQVYYAKHYRQFVATAPSTAVAVLAGAPFENVKTRMQSKHFPSILQAFKYTYQTEGLRGFWTGTWPPLISITANRIAAFLVYRKAKYTIDDYVVKPLWGDSAIKYSNDFDRYPNLWTNLCYVPAGMLSGAATTVFLTPVELVKNAAQTSVLMASQNGGAQDSKRVANRVGSYGAARQIIRNRGVAALWTGFQLHFVRDVIGSGVYFGVYEILKQTFGTFFHLRDPNGSWAPALAGGMSGLVAWTMTYPLDTSKTRAQNNLLGIKQATPAAIVAQPSQSIAMYAKPPMSVSEALSAVAKGTKPASRWHGVEMIIVRSFIQNMIQMTGFERMKIWIDGLEFRSGQKSLPGIERDRGKDTKIWKLQKEQEEAERRRRARGEGSDL